MFLRTKNLYVLVNLSLIYFIVERSPIAQSYKNILYKNATLLIGTVKLQQTFGRGVEDIMLFVEVSLYGVELSNVPSFQERAVKHLHLMQSVSVSPASRQLFP